MKKVVCTLLLLAVMLTFTSCNNEYTLVGFDKVNSYSSEAGLCVGLLPLEEGSCYFDEFAALFETVDKNAFYSVEETFNDTKELVLVYLKYTDNSYADAKKYIFDNLTTLSKTVFAESGDYVFYKNESLVGRDLFVAFNDETKSVVSFGSILWGKYQKEHELITTDFNAYLSLFSEYYDFTK